MPARPGYCVASNWLMNIVKGSRVRHEAAWPLALSLLPKPYAGEYAGALGLHLSRLAGCTHLPRDPPRDS